MIGQPIRGNHKSVQNVTQDHIKDYLDAHYIASRMVLVATGGVDPKQVSELGEKHFGKTPKAGREITGDDRPIFTPSSIQIRDDDIELVHMGLFYQAPSWNHEDFFAFQMLKRLHGEWIPERDAIINHPELQYNHIHKGLGDIEDFPGYEAIYMPFSDVGVFGHSFMSLDMSAFIPPIECLKSTRYYTGLIMESELYRARNRYYNDLMNNVLLNGWSSEIANQLMYAKRRIPRSEIAKRVSNLDPKYLERTYAKWLWDTELAIAMYGPIFYAMRFYSVFRSVTNQTSLT